MKKISLLVIILIATIAYISCERDDICPESTPTTPNLIIDIFNADDTESLKNAVNLLIVGVENKDTLGIYLAESTIQLPLNTNKDTTQYILHNNYKVKKDGSIEGKKDIITINYTREDVFVSRACGYKTIFKDVIFKVESKNWIQSSQPANNNQSIEDEQEAHYIIFY